MSNVINYYADGNTSRGYYNLFANNLADLKKIFILKGGPGTGKSSLMKTVGEQWVEKDYDVEYIHCSSDNNALDGVLNSSLKIGIVDGTMPHVIEPTAPGAIEEYVNLGDAWDSSKLEPCVDNILDLRYRINNAYRKAYEHFESALKIHDEWEKIYILNMDKDKASVYASKVINLLLKDNKFNKPASEKHRFMGAATHEGPVDFVENLTSTLQKRYFIKGRPGTGKSTLLKQLIKTAGDRGIDIEAYHCGLDPNSLDMIIMRELDVCIFDSTSPHEYFPSRDNDEIIDMYKAIIAHGTDEKYEKELKNIISRYKGIINQGTAYLSQAKELNDELEKYYINAMDFKKLDKIKEELIRTLLKYE